MVEMAEGRWSVELGSITALAQSPSLESSSEVLQAVGMGALKASLNAQEAEAAMLIQMMAQQTPALAQGQQTIDIYA